ncbi:hypothetical protein [Nocardia sp. NBC_01388]
MCRAWLLRGLSWPVLLLAAAPILSYAVAVGVHGDGFVAAFV